MSGGSGTVTTFSPNTDPTCYAPRMTRAQAIARRAAGTLRENCVVVVTDGPTIGVAGNTSTTEIELQPQSPTELGMHAIVHTTYDNMSWDGLYDIDLGTGTLIRLEDNLGNIVDDPRGTNVQTAFPWNFPLVVDNRIEGVPTLTGWGVSATAGTRILGNRILTGLTPGVVVFDITGVVGSLAGTPSIIQGNIVTLGSTITLASPAGTRLNYQFNVTGALATVNVTNNSTAAGALFTNNKIEGQAVINCTFAAADATAVFDENHLWDDVRVDITPGAAVTSMFVNANEIRGSVLGSGTPHLLINKPSGTISLDQNDFNVDQDATMWRFGGTGADFIRLNTFTAAFAGDTIISTGGSISLNACVITDLLATLSGAGGLNISRSMVVNSTINQLGTARLTIQDSDLYNGTFTSAAAATRPLILSNIEFIGNGSITQNRTGGAGATSDTIQRSRITGGTITLSGAVDPTINQTFTRIQTSGTVNITDPAAVATPINDLVVTAQSVFNLQAGGGAIQAVRVGGGGTLSSGPFAQTGVTYEILAAQTLLAPNVNTLRNVGFSNTV